MTTDKAEAGGGAARASGARGHGREFWWLAGMLAVLGLAVGGALGWKPLVARYWLRQYLAGDKSAGDKIVALGPAAVSVLVGHGKWTEPGGVRQADRRLGSDPDRVEGPYKPPPPHPADILARLGEDVLFEAIARSGADHERRARFYYALGQIPGEKPRRAWCRAHLDASLELWRYSPDRWIESRPAALLYLAARQEDDGRWDAARWGAEGATDVEVTALALMTFLGANQDEQYGPYPWAVRGARRFLMRVQSAEGRVGSGGRCEHLLAAIALVERWGCGSSSGLKDPALRDAAQRAVDFAFREESPEATPDAISTALTLSLAKGAKLSELRVPGGIVARVVAIQSALNELTVADGPEAGLVRPRPGEAPTGASCAAGCFTLDQLGVTRSDPRRQSLMKEVCRRRAEVVADPLAMWQASWVAFGVGRETWNDWSGFLRKSLQPTQIARGNSFGGWPVESSAERRLGGIGTTALHGSCFDFYYVILPIYATDGE